jgi:hypothetical protein
LFLLLCSVVGGENPCLLERQLGLDRSREAVVHIEQFTPNICGVPNPDLEELLADLPIGRLSKAAPSHK